MELVLQALIEAETTEHIGAARYERSATRTTQRNAARERPLATKAGDVELRIPKLRKGSFFPSILSPSVSCCGSQLGATRVPHQADGHRQVRKVIEGPELRS